VQTLWKALLQGLRKLMVLKQRQGLVVVLLLWVAQGLC
jgi:hypothetical protein